MIVAKDEAIPFKRDLEDFTNIYEIIALNLELEN